MSQIALRSTLLVSCLLGFGVLANTFFLQSSGYRLAMMTPVERPRPAAVPAPSGTQRPGAVAHHAPAAWRGAMPITTPGGRTEVRTGARRQAQARPTVVAVAAPAAEPVTVEDALRPSRELVSAIQRELYARSYTHRPPDGTLDNATRAAILAWESDNGVTLTATPTDGLLKALLLGASVELGSRHRRPTPQAQRLIRHIQAMLVQHKLGPVAPTGRLDGPTRAAIMAFERSEKLKVRGIITETLLLRLERLGFRG